MILIVSFMVEDISLINNITDNSIALYDTITGELFYNNENNIR